MSGKVVTMRGFKQGRLRRAVKAIKRSSCSKQKAESIFSPAQMKQLDEIRESLTNIDEVGVRPEKGNFEAVFEEANNKGDVSNLAALLMSEF